MILLWDIRSYQPSDNPGQFSITMCERMMFRFATWHYKRCFVGVDSFLNCTKMPNLNVCETISFSRVITGLQIWYLYSSIHTADTRNTGPRHRTTSSYLLFNNIRERILFCTRRSCNNVEYHRPDHPSSLPLAATSQACIGPLVAQRMLRCALAPVQQIKPQAPQVIRRKYWWWRGFTLYTRIRV